MWKRGLRLFYLFSRSNSHDSSLDRIEHTNDRGFNISSPENTNTIRIVKPKEPADTSNWQAKDAESGEKVHKTTETEQQANDKP